MYKISGQYVIRLSDNAYIPTSEDNADYQSYLHWLADGNTPLPQDPPPVLPPPGPTTEERLEAAEQLIDMLLEDTNG